MNYLSTENLSKTFGDKVLFEGLSFGFHKGYNTSLSVRSLKEQAIS